MACALALAELAREPIPDQVKKAYPDREFKFGRDYVIPTPFDNRLITRLPIAVAKAAISSGVAQILIDDFDAYAKQLESLMQK